MERYTMLLDWKNQHCENNSTTKAIYRFNAIPIKIPMTFFLQKQKRNPKICMESQKTSNSESNPENKARSITLPDFKLYCKAIVIKTLWYWYKNRNIEQ